MPVCVNTFHFTMDVYLVQTGVTVLQIDMKSQDFICGCFGYFLCLQRQQWGFVSTASVTYTFTLCSRVLLTLTQHPSDCL